MPADGQAGGRSSIEDGGARSDLRETGARSVRGEAGARSTAEEAGTPRGYISLVLCCSAVPSQVKSFLEHVAATQPLSRIELLLVAWEGCDYLPLVPAGFRAQRLVPFDRRAPLNEARARAVWLATAPVIVLMEDHVRMRGKWVEELLRRFEEGPHAAVGWSVVPGNVDSTVSWAGYLVEYGAWNPGLAAGPKTHLPGHNCAYRRATLLERGQELPSLLRAESILHWGLARAGESLLFDPGLLMRHYQFLSLNRLLASNFWYGWNFADSRQEAERWSLPRRWLQALAFPLIPLIRWKRLAGTADFDGRPRGILLRCAPVITLTFLAASAGEALGHLLGARSAPLRLTYMELAFDRRPA